MTYCLTFREKILHEKAKLGLTNEQTSERFGVSMSSLFRWQKKLEPCTTRNKPATKIDMDLLKQDIEDHPDAYLQERADRLGVSKQGIHNALQRLGVTRKKNAKTPQSGRKTTYSLPKKNRTVRE